MSRVLPLKGLRENVPLAPLTTFKIGGPARFFYCANSVRELVGAVRAARAARLPVFILGGGSNVLVSDSGFDGLVIKNCSSNIKLVGRTGILVDSGVPTSKLVAFATDKGLTGVEFLVGIPGTVGGAVYHNARFRDPRSFCEYFVDFHLVKDRFMGDLVERVTVLTPDDEVVEVDKDYCKFNYSGSGLRSGFKKGGDVILRVLLKLKRAEKGAIKDAIKAFVHWRATRSDKEGRRQGADPVSGSVTTQPAGKTAGCIFSNVPNKWNHPSGRMIDMCGLKGKRIGGAQISEKHANFIVNVDGAKASDVVALISLCKEKVKEKFGVELKEEIQYLGFSDVGV